MKFPLIIIFCFSTFFVSAQDPQRRGKVDSLRYFSEAIRKLQNEYYDSLVNSDEYKKLAVGYYQHKGYESRSYSLDLFVDYAHNNFGNLNSYLQNSGFSPLAEFGARIGAGMTFVKDRRVLNFNFWSISVGQKSKKMDKNVTSNSFDFFQLNLGYNILRSDKILLYPFFGPSFRISSIDYYSPKLFKPSFTGIEDYVILDNSFSATKQNLYLHYGFTIDFKFPKQENPRKHQHLFVRVEANRPVGNNAYKLNGSFPIFTQEANWLISTGYRLGFDY